MVESVLRASGHTTGLFTSPHLADVRERVRLSGRPLPKDRFAAHFWAARDLLLEAAQRAEDEAAKGGGDSNPPSSPSAVGMPGYFRFLTLLGLRIFLQEPCPLPAASGNGGSGGGAGGAVASPPPTAPPPPDAVVLEVGIGGRLDATNVIDKPAAVGIASLGFDHMELLGDTLPQIAAEKAGVIKQGAPVFTVEQPQDAAAVLARAAREAGASPPEARVARALASYTREDGSQNAVPLGLRGDHQRANAALAVALASAWEEQWVAKQQQQQQGGGGGSSSGNRPVSPERLARAAERVELLRRGVLPREYVQGLATTVWPGRSQVIRDQEFLVGALLPAPPATPAAAAACLAAEDSLAASRQEDSCLTFYLDGAHTPESMASCAQWFAEEACSGEGEGESGGSSSSSSSKTLRFLFFNCTRERAPAALLPALVTGLAARGAAPHAALFVPPDSQYGFLAAGADDERSAAARLDLSWQRALRDEWDICALSIAGQSGQKSEGVARALAALPALEPDAGEEEERRPAPPPSLGRGAVVPGGVAGAVAWLRECARSDPELRIKVLVTGSLYLVGDVLRALDHAPQ
jgi:folylpolyglutamate synthase